MKLIDKLTEIRKQVVNEVEAKELTWKAELLNLMEGEPNEANRITN